MTYTAAGWENYWRLNKERHNERRRNIYKNSPEVRKEAKRRSQEQVERKRKAREEAHGR